MSAVVGLGAMVAPDARAWGPTGHRVVAELALAEVRPHTRRALRRILGAEPLAALSTWPDWIRSDPSHPDLGRWHFVSVETPADLEAALAAPPHALWALADAEARLADRALPPATRRDALAWVVHLVADLHQPLHVGRAGDHGGNDLAVTWMGRPTTLHRLWDEDLIDHERLSYTELALWLGRTPAVGAEDPPLTWVAEALHLRDTVYDTGDGSLDWDYRFRAWPVVEDRLRQAGARLARRLDAAFARPQRSKQ